MSYDALRVDVDMWLARDDVSLNGVAFPTIVKLAEVDINRSFRGVDVEANSTLIIVSRSTPLPVHFKSMISIDLDYLPYEQAVRCPEEKGTPTSYSIAHNEGQAFIRLSPTPDKQITLPISYFAKAVSVESQGDNSLIRNNYDIYLYCVLKHAMIFLQEDPTAYDMLFRQAVAEEHLASNQARWGLAQS